MGDLNALVAELYMHDRPSFESDMKKLVHAVRLSFQTSNNDYRKQALNVMQDLTLYVHSYSEELLSTKDKVLEPLQAMVGFWEQCFTKSYQRAMLSQSDDILSQFERDATLVVKLNVQYLSRFEKAVYDSVHSLRMAKDLRGEKRDYIFIGANDN